MRICVIGEGMLELSSAGDAAWRVRYGGDTLNTAIHLARFGRHVQFFTALGADEFSTTLKTSWGKEGLDLSLVLTAPDKRPGLYAITTDAAGERTFTYWRSDSAARGMLSLPDSAAALTRCAEADVVIFSLITLAILPDEARTSLIDSCRQARDSGRQVVFDGNYRPNLWPSTQAAKHWRDRALEVCTIGLPTLADELLLEGEVSPARIAQRWSGNGRRETILKLGAQGCLLPNSELLPASKAAAVIDTSGAGDAFNAGYVHARLEGALPHQAGALGHQLAAWVIARRGAIPDRDAAAPYAHSSLR